MCTYVVCIGRPEHIKIPKNNLPTWQQNFKPHLGWLKNIKSYMFFIWFVGWTANRPREVTAGIAVCPLCPFTQIRHATKKDWYFICTTYTYTHIACTTKMYIIGIKDPCSLSLSFSWISLSNDSIWYTTVDIFYKKIIFFLVTEKKRNIFKVLFWYLV